MTSIRTILSVAAFLVALALLPPGSAHAQIDRIYPESGSAVSGTISDVSKNGVTVKVGGATQTFAPGQITKIMFQGDPAPLTEGRQFAVDRQYEQALETLRTLDPEELPREVIEEDALFYRVLSEAKLALAGKGDKKAAAVSALKFASEHSDSWHFYQVAELLGDLALSLENYEQALKYYGSLRRAPATETKIRSVYLTGLVHLQQGDLAAAKAEFEKVMGVSVQSVAAARLKTLATAGQAVALSREGKGKEGLELVKSLINELDPTDVEMAARIYNAQGASYEASGDAEGAVLAYLHTHLMFSSLPDAHAEALSRLVELWPQVGKPDRAAEARQELRQRYPGYEG